MKLIKVYIFFLSIIFVFPSFGQQSDVPVPMGSWREHFSFREVKQIEEVENRIYALCELGIFYINKNDMTLQRLTKLQGLTSVGLKSLAYDNQTKTLVVGYEDGNIDLVVKSNIYNISDIKRKNISGGKSINHITIYDKKAYLACDFGIVVIDLVKRETKDAYFIGQNNASVIVNQVAITGSNIYAATAEGLFKAQLNAIPLADFNNWKQDSSMGKSMDQIVRFNDKIILSSNISSSLKIIYYQKEGDSLWKVLDTLRCQAIRTSGNQFLLIDREKEDLWTIRCYNNNLERIKNHHYDLPFWLINPTDVLMDKSGIIWSSDGYKGLYYIKTDESSGSFDLSTPYTNSVFSLSHTGKSLLMSEGSITSSYVPVYQMFSMSKFADDRYWYWYNCINDEKSCGVHDALYAVEDPMQPEHIFVSSYTKGLLEFQNNTCINVYNASNSSLRTVSEDQTVRVGSLAFDSKGQLWMTNALVENALSVKKRDNTWESYNLSNLFITEPGKMIVDYYDQKWLSLRTGELVVAREKSNGGMEALFVDVNNGNNYPSKMINCLVEDEMGYIWIGTERGIKINRVSKQIFNNPAGNTSSVETQTIIVGPDGEGFPLLSTESVLSIAVDGADRKWIGTQSSGLFLVSADGKTEIHHFTTDNSPLISNTITALSISPATGEVFIGTDKGLMSYMSDASKGTETHDNVLIYPNPVKSDYTGYITIRGLVTNADVKITDIRGKVVYHTLAKGGTVAWNGYTMEGIRPKTGVYLVFSTDEEGKETFVGKFMFIH